MKSKTEQEPFLSQEFVDCLETEENPKPVLLHQLQYWIISFVIHCSIAITVTSVSLYYAVFLTNRCGAPTMEKNGVHSPIPISALQYQTSFPSLDSWGNKLFMGEPNYESDMAWNKLLGVETFKITHEDASKLNISVDRAIPLKMGDGYAGILGVVHNLHCLRRIRQSRYPDYYYPNQTAEQRARDEHHNYHCLEAIRQSVMCNPDLTPYPYYHSGIVDHDLSANPGVITKCINYDRLNQWFKEERMVPYDQIVGPPLFPGS